MESMNDGYRTIEDRYTIAIMPASEAILTQILAQLEAMQLAQQTLQAKVSYSLRWLELELELSLTFFYF